MVERRREAGADTNDGRSCRRFLYYSPVRFSWIFVHNGHARCHPSDNIFCSVVVSS